MSAKFHCLKRGRCRLRASTWRVLPLAKLHTMVLAATVFAGHLQAQEWELSVEVGAELRVFPSEPQFADQDDTYFSPSLWIQPEIDYEWGDGDNRLTLTPFARWDADDDNRTHADVREANWLHIGEDWDIVVGLNRVFWGVAESRHLVDIINQTDLVEDIDEEDKLGQPMVNVNLQTDVGIFGLFVLPGFRERTFPDREARLRGALEVDTDDPSYEATNDEWHVDLAARWSDVIGDFDVGLAAFSGTSREPRFLPALDGAGRTILKPRYDLIDQESLDIQYTNGPWLLKLEALTRGGQGDRFYAAVGGFEFTFFEAFDSPVDFGVLAEFLYDGRDEDAKVAPPTFANNDVFLGTRLALNDVQGTQLLAGVTVDVETGATAASVELERRLGSNMSIEVNGRFFANVPDDDSVLSGIRDDGFISARLIRFF